MGAGRHIGFHAEYRLYAVLFALLIEVYNAVHGSVVGYGKGIHTKLLRPGHKLVYAGRAVQQAVLGMYVQMCESAHQLSPICP